LPQGPAKRELVRRNKQQKKKKKKNKKLLNLRPLAHCEFPLLLVKLKTVFKPRRPENTGTALPKRKFRFQLKFPRDRGKKDDVDGVLHRNGRFPPSESPTEQRSEGGDEGRRTNIHSRSKPYLNASRWWIEERWVCETQQKNGKRSGPRTQTRLKGKRY